MKDRMTAEEYKQLQSGQSRPKKRIHNNTPTFYQSTQGFSRTYQSRKEADFAKELDRMRDAGEILSWIPQVRFPFQTEDHYVDFLCFLPDDTYRLYEVKGFRTQTGERKRKNACEIFRVRIEVW